MVEAVRRHDHGRGTASQGSRKGEWPPQAAPGGVRLEADALKELLAKSLTVVERRDTVRFLVECGLSPARGSWYRSRGRPFSIPSRSVTCAVQRPGCYVHTAYPRAIPDGVARADRRFDRITHPDSNPTDRRFVMSTNRCYLIQSWCLGTGICCASSEAERRYTQRSAAGYHWLLQENLQCCRLSASMIA